MHTPQASAAPLSPLHRRPRRAGVGWALLVALPIVMLVAPSIMRLVLFARGAAPADASDVAFATHPFTSLTHVVAGLVMVAAVPVQTSARIRARWPALHRGAGWLFVVCGLCVVGSGAWMNVVFPRIGGMWKVVAIDVTILGFAGTLGIAIAAIKRGDVAAHRRWVLRTVAFALAGGTASMVLFPYFLAFGPPGDAAVAVGRWLSVVCNVVVVEVFLRRRTAVVPVRG